MTGGILAYGLLAALAIALLFAAFTDLRARVIENWLTLGMALAAPLFWWATGLSPWPGMALQLGLGLAVFAALAGLFALGAMGGGDVKLLSALALWLPWQPFLKLVVLMALIGGALTIVVAARHRIARRPGRVQVPYGVAIAAAGLWVLAGTYGPASAFTQ
jgi:prepilin peptidase CpaA